MMRSILPTPLVMSQIYFVARGPNSGFIAALSLDEIRDQLLLDQLKESYYITESDGRSFNQFQATCQHVRWRTIAEFLVEQLQGQQTVAAETAMPLGLIPCPACGRHPCCVSKPAPPGAPVACTALNASRIP